MIVLAETFCTMLPSEFTPRYLFDLVRIGPPEDGGYVVPRRIIPACTLLVSLGLSDDWRFEQSFQQISGAKVVCYDHTVTGSFWVKAFAINTLAALGGRFHRFRKLFDVLRYCKYFNGQTAIHYQRRIGYRENGDEDIDSIMNANRNDRVFIKMDIEGSEYRVLDQLLNYPDRIAGFVIEFHDTDLFFDRILDFLRRSTVSYCLVHVHANNYSQIAPNGIPTVLELTWIAMSQVRNDDFDQSPSYPINGLDFPNDRSKPDIPLKFESTSRWSN